MDRPKERMEALVGVIRRDPNVGRGSCAMIDECYTDEELYDEMTAEGVDHPEEALAWAYDREGLWREQGTNCSSGEPDCPLIAAAEEFEAARKKMGI